MARRGLDATQGGDAKVVLQTTVGNTQYIDMSNSTFCTLFIPSGTASLTITWYGCNRKDGTFMKIVDESDTDVTSAVDASSGDKATQIPGKACGFNYVKPVSTVAVTAGVEVGIKG